LTEIAQGMRASATRDAILEAAQERLLADGFARLSTRGVAASAGVPLSQVHYHFGSKQQLILELLEVENNRRLTRQKGMFAEDVPLWVRYEQACDFLEDDLDSGYVRILQEMIALGWSVSGWFSLLVDVAREVEARYDGALGPFTAEEVAALIAQVFYGGEAMLLLGFERRQWPVRSSLRRIGVLIRALEEGGAGDASSGAG
jgi:AcrR family transcriptional regulator